ncbi:DUF2254 family protein [Polyangium sp. y55x31]|uniref:DUF2254 family protein n=1 Tax=Polyangium sp. y55x31 TaxID=3042688 RepID=UPI0024828BB0|nr:DUF2254 family protein [Polyangium sp. y55x31]MDI1477493.1 DUF2254 family protein [Polyangium sp. y55x31]
MPKARLAFSNSLWLYPLSILAIVSVTAFVAFRLLDISHAQPGGVTALFGEMSPDDASRIMGGTGEVIAAILGIVITVASIIVQLAATRYTPRITDMFFRDRTNRAVIAFFVVSAVFSLWVNYAIRQAPDAAQSFVPRFGVMGSIVLLTLSLLVMAPYFNYVFDFLEPDKIVERIRRGGVAQALTRSRGESEDEVDGRRMTALSALEHLADIGLNAIEQKDKGIASNTVDAICDLVVAYMPHKRELDDRWFSIRGRLLKDADFVSMNEIALGKLQSDRTWLEYKALRQFLMVFREALTEMPDIVNRIAIGTRYIGLAALAAEDRAALATVIKFFNTYMRRALNARDVPAAYNCLNQYRYLGEKILSQGWGDEALRIAGHFKYYAQTAHAMKLAFVTETVAFDLCALNELAYDLGVEVRDELLQIFLEVDKEAEVAQQEQSLRGVRKAQVKLATYYLQKGEIDLARRIHRDMRDERPDRLRSIKNEMLSVTTNEFWEINDRGVVFEYIEPERHAHLHQFFEWFPHLEGHPREAGGPKPPAPVALTPGGAHEG